MNNTAPATHYTMIQMPKSVRKLLKERKRGKTADDEEEEEDDLEDIDRITKEEAYLFPIFGSITLLGLFLAFKYLDKVHRMVFVTIRSLSG